MDHCNKNPLLRTRASIDQGNKEPLVTKDNHATKDKCIKSHGYLQRNNATKDQCNEGNGGWRRKRGGWGLSGGGGGRGGETSARRNCMIKTILVAGELLMPDPGA